MLRLIGANNNSLTCVYAYAYYAPMLNTTTAPTASGVIVDKVTRTAVFETFQKSLVDKLNTAKYEAVPIEDYLIEFNERVRRQALREHA